jgi:hypothetical protein
VNKNLYDYKKIWLPVIFESIQNPEITTVSLLWPDLCHLCGLDFLPANLNQNEPQPEVTA